MNSLDNTSTTLKILRFFCPPELFEEIEGDLRQIYFSDLRKHGQRRAKIRLTWNTMRFFRPGILLRRKMKSTNRGTSMLGHYLKLAFRGMMKNKVFTLINVSGLAVSLVAFFLIIQYVSFELSYDRFHKDSDQLYRIVHKQYENGELKNSSALTYPGMRDLIRKNFPEITEYTGVAIVPIDLGYVLGYKNKMFWEPGRVLQADTSFFKVFRNLITKGNYETALSEPNNLVISENFAKKIFGQDNPINEQLDDPDDHNMTGKLRVVSGVFQNLPANSHLEFDLVIAMDESYDTVPNYWQQPAFHTYMRLPASSDPVAIERRLNSLLRAVAEDHKLLKGAVAELQPVTDIHLGPFIPDEMTPGNEMSMIWILSAISVIILLIAWINYINLETARFLSQAHEVGVRRVIGSSAKDLTLQYLIRYLSLNTIAFIFAAISIYLIIPHFSYLTGVPIANLRIDRPEVWIGSGTLFLIGSLIVAAYPVVLLLKLNPAQIIKGIVATSGRSLSLKGTMVTFQFTVSIVLIIFLVVVGQQVEFMRISNKKIDIDRVITIQNPGTYRGGYPERLRNFTILKDKLLQDASIGAVTASSNIPGKEINFTLVDNIKKTKETPYDPTRYKLLFIDYDYVRLYGLKLKAGRNYKASEKDNSDDRILVNDMAIRQLGFANAEEAIGQKVHMPMWDSDPSVEIIGVIEDYHHQAIKKPVDPTIYFFNGEGHQQAYFSVRLNAGSDPAHAVSHIERAWNEVYPDVPFNFAFLDTLYDQQFKSEIHFSRIFSLFSIVALFLAGLGLVGMTLFEANARIREISIRKILGASVSGIIALLSKERLRIVVVSIAIAFPLSWYLSSQWLLDYPQRIALSWHPFAIALGSMLLLTIIASGFQTWRAAESNPVDHLKQE